MKSKPLSASKALALVAPLATLTITPAHAAFDAFLKIDGIDGEATDQRHRDHIEVFSWSWGVANREATGGGGGKVSVSEITITKEVDKSSPKLFLSTAIGEPAGDVVLRMAESRESDEKTVYYQLELKDVYVTSIDSNVRTRKEELTENITLNFSEITFSFANRDESGAYVDLDKDEKPVRATIANPDRERQ